MDDSCIGFTMIQYEFELPYVPRRLRSDDMCHLVCYWFHNVLTQALGLYQSASYYNILYQLTLLITLPLWRYTFYDGSCMMTTPYHFISHPGSSDKVSLPLCCDDTETSILGWALPSYTSFGCGSLPAYNLKIILSQPIKN